MTEEQKTAALEHYKEKGWARIEQCIPSDWVSWLRELFVRTREEQKPLLRQEKPYGSGTYWEGVDSLSMVNEDLFKIYTSDLTKEILNIFCKEAYCFIEEAIIKMPGEDFRYTEHIDRVGGTDPRLFNDPLYDQITLAWILTDLTTENGTLEIKEGEEYLPVYPKAGDIMVWNDTLWHRSGPNHSEEPRIIWINFFTMHPIGRTEEINKDYYDLKIIP
jgi:hypothetical protein